MINYPLFMRIILYLGDFNKINYLTLKSPIVYLRYSSLRHAITITQVDIVRSITCRLRFMHTD